MKRSTRRFHRHYPITRIIAAGVLLALILASLACGGAAPPAPEPVEQPYAGEVPESTPESSGSGGCFAMAGVVVVGAGVFGSRRLRW